MRWRTQIATGQVRVLLIDECHLLWGDACGYVWGKTNQRIEVPIASERQRQTYYGAFDYGSKQFYVQAYDALNTDNTIAFLKYLRSVDQQARKADYLGWCQLPSLAPVTGVLGYCQRWITL